MSAATSPARCRSAGAGLNAQAMLADARRAYLVLGAEPEFDCANPVAARAALEQAEFVVVMSPFRHGAQYADVLLPISPFTETAGTFVNCEGRAQAFNGVVKPLGETRPAWKVLRVLGSLLGAARLRFRLDRGRARVAARGRRRRGASSPTGRASRIAKPATRRAPAWSASPTCRSISPTRWCAARRRCSRPPTRSRRGRGMNALTLAQLGVAEGAQVQVRQGRGEAVLTAVADAGVPAGVVRIAAAHPSTCGLEGLSGPIDRGAGVAWTRMQRARCAPVQALLGPALAASSGRS